MSELILGLTEEETAQIGARLAAEAAAALRPPMADVVVAVDQLHAAFIKDTRAKRQARWALVASFVGGVLLAVILFSIARG